MSYDSCKFELSFDIFIFCLTVLFVFLSGKNILYCVLYMSNNFLKKEIDKMKTIYNRIFLIVGMMSNQLYCQTEDTNLYQMITQSKEQIKWDCARLIYLLVQDAISKVSDRLVYITLHQQVQWVFDSTAMQEVVEMANVLVSKAELYAIAASIARQNNDEDAILVLQIQSEYARKSWLARHASLLIYGFGTICGYVGGYYFPFNKELLQRIKIG
jgi:hypothetical protein